MMSVAAASETAQGADMVPPVVDPLFYYSFETMDGGTTSVAVKADPDQLVRPPVKRTKPANPDKPNKRVKKVKPAKPDMPAKPVNSVKPAKAGDERKKVGSVVPLVRLYSFCACLDFFLATVQATVFRGNGIRKSPETDPLKIKGHPRPVFLCRFRGCRFFDQKLSNLRRHQNPKNKMHVHRLNPGDDGWSVVKSDITSLYCRFEAKLRSFGEKIEAASRDGVWRSSVVNLQIRRSCTWLTGPWSSGTRRTPWKSFPRCWRRRWRGRWSPGCRCGRWTASWPGGRPSARTACRRRRRCGGGRRRTA